MAIYSASISDDVINTLLQSPDPSMVALGKEYMEAKEQTDKELGRDKGFMGAVSDIFGFGSAQGAEPNTGQRYNNQFSVTQEPQFDFRGTPMIPGTDVMQGSVFKDFFDQAPEPNFTGINQVLSPEKQLELYLKQEGGEIDPNDVNRFAPQSFFSNALNFAQRPDVRTGLGYLFGGIPGAALSFFAPKIGGGISNLINRFKPAPNIPVRNIGDTDMSRNVTTGSGQSVSDSDLSSIGDTGFSEYSDPGTAASYEGSF
jgi:hypothetical protein